MKRNYKLLITAFILVVILTAVYFINSSKVNDSQENLVEEGSSPASIEKVNDLPSNFPEDFPIYPEASITEAVISRDEESEALSVFWVTPDSVDQVAEFYDDKLTEQQWSVNYVSSDESAIIFSFNKGEFSGFAIIDIVEEGQVMISVSVGTGSIAPSI